MQKRGTLRIIPVVTEKLQAMPKPQSDRRGKTSERQGEKGESDPILRNEGDLRDAEAFVELMREGVSGSKGSESIDLWSQVIDEVAAEPN